MSKGSHDCRKHCRGCGHIVDLVAGECPVCEYVHYVDEKKNDVEPTTVLAIKIEPEVRMVHMSFKLDKENGQSE